MAEIMTDSHQFTVTVIQHANLEITNTNIPTNVESGTPFNIEYEVTNNGATDNCYGHIFNATTETIVPGSEWTESIDAGAVVQKSFEISGGITEQLDGIVVVGYVN